MADHVAAPLPELTLSPGMTVTVSADAVGAIVTKLNVKVFQEVPTSAAGTFTARPILVASTSRE